VEVDAYVPERAGEWSEERALGGEWEAEPGAGHRAPRPALRLLEIPEEVTMEFSDGRPCALWWRGEHVALSRAAGPERLSGDWWSEPYRRDYWRGDSERGELLVFIEGGRWFVQGWYD